MKAVSGTRGLEISLEGVTLREIRCFASLDRSSPAELTVDSMTHTKDRITIDMSLEKRVRLTWTLQAEEQTVLMHVRAETLQEGIGALNTFAAEEALTLSIGGVGDAQTMLGETLFSPWWCRPTFPASLGEVEANTQMLLCRLPAAHLFLFPQVSDSFRADFSGQNGALALRLNPGLEGTACLEGYALALGVADDPFRAISQTYAACAHAGSMVTPCRSGRSELPGLDELGWCSWDAFYHDVSAHGVEDKLRELQDKQVPVGWILIDDGWSETRSERLVSFHEDREKFPEGLRAVAQAAHERYGVQRVGVWHAFTGYWKGVDSEGEIARTMPEALSATRSGYLLPGFSMGQAFAFYDAWHSYLQAQGIDFVKVDNQSSLIHFTRHNAPLRAVRDTHDALEKSVRLHFASPMINCMGMGSETVTSRRYSLIARSSDDFVPQVAGSFVKHIMQNGYNAVFQDGLTVCDFDMWWTMHPDAVAHGVLRAISGGPVYISDPVGKTDPAQLLPLLDDDGHVIRCDHAARPAPSCLYENVPEQSGVLRLTNCLGDGCVTALFNLTEQDRVWRFAREDTECAPDADYLAHLHFAGVYAPLDHMPEIRLPAGGVEIVNLYPVEQGACLVGDESKYIGIGLRRSRMEVRNIRCGK